MDEISGIINIYKEPGYTSHDVVARLRGILHTRKIGHTGTLDPMAEGVLPVCVGAATKLCELLSDHDKEYEAVMLLGRTYDTLDVTGECTGMHEVMSTDEEIESVIRSFIGGYDQIPPMYSAKKVDGKKLYELARSGHTIERQPVPVRIYDIEVLAIDRPRVRLRIRCGKGTYIRSLIDDIGKKLGCGAAMEELVRTKVADFDMADACRLDMIEQAMADNKISNVIIDLETFFADIPAVRMTQELSKLLRNGNVISGKDIRRLAGETLNNAGSDTRIRMYDDKGTFTGVYEYKISYDIYKPYKMFL